MFRFSEYVIRSAKSYYSTYETRALAISAIDHEISEEMAGHTPIKSKIETLNQIKDYLKDPKNSVLF